jgi:hypothetical protein
MLVESGGNKMKNEQTKSDSQFGALRRAKDSQRIEKRVKADESDWLKTSQSDSGDEGKEERKRAEERERGSVLLLIWLEQFKRRKKKKSRIHFVCLSLIRPDSSDDCN